MTGVLFLVVGPSGVGKDTLLDGARQALAGSRWFRFARRCITRPADAGGEDHIATDDAAFDAAVAAGRFLHHWAAHDLRYGVPADVLADLAAGVNVVVNTSRAELQGFARRHPRTVVLHVTASPEAVARRLAARGRESGPEVAARLAREAALDAGALRVIDIRNDGTPAEGVAVMVAAIAGAVDLRLALRESPVSTPGRPLCLLPRANPVARMVADQAQRVEVRMGDRMLVAGVAAVDPAAALVGADDCALPATALSQLGARPGDVVLIRPTPSPASRETLRRKIRGEELSLPEIERFVGDMVTGRYSDAEIAGFLVSAAANLTRQEVAYLAQVRAGFAHRQTWDAATVVDKHSMGGIPGNRITPLVIPIVAAHGLTFPKTSSRAITSAAGTADAMEVLARVDLTSDEMQRVVRATGACIAWNGRLTHSPVDDVMNAINRPLGLSSAFLDVSSIISKKLAAGSSHVLIDIPVGPEAKTKSAQAGAELADLFVSVGAAVGLKVRAELTDGSRAIGRGIGPALEMRDVLAVLENEPDAPADLREKALRFAAILIGWAEGLPEDAARAAAETALASGRARDRLWQIVEAQGRRETPPRIGAFTHDIVAPRAGLLAGHGIAALSRLARATGAPVDASAGVDILRPAGSHVAAGEPVLRLHAGAQFFIDAAQETLGDIDALLLMAP